MLGRRSTTCRNGRAEKNASSCFRILPDVHRDRRCDHGGDRRYRRHRSASGARLAHRADRHGDRSPWLFFFVLNVAKWEWPRCRNWVWTLGTAILLFATSTPVEGDFAPLLPSSPSEWSLRSFIARRGGRRRDSYRSVAGRLGALHWLDATSASTWHSWESAGW